MMNSLAGDLPGSFVDVCCAMLEGVLNWERNATGHTISKSGVAIEMFDWLSSSFKFQYECVPQMDSERFTRDNVTNKTVWTSLYQVKYGACHVSPEPYVLTYDRYKEYADFLSPFIYTPFKLLIPLPEVALGGISSVWRPFETSVWTALLVTIFLTMVLSLFNWLYSRSRVTSGERDDVRLELHWLFLFGLLMSKAGYSAPDSFKMRLAGGAWCLAALLLTNYYSSVLTSLITTTTPVPIANSLEEVANNDNIDVMLVKGFGANVLITGGVDNALLKKIGKKMDSYKDSLCPNQTECFRRIKERKTTVFLHDEPSLMSLLSDDYRRTGKCNVAFAKESYGMMYIGWTISKNYSQFEYYQRGMLRMMETGLVDHWMETFLPKPSQCLVDSSSRQAMMDDIRNPALVDLVGLVSAYVCLLFGSIVSFVVFLAECVKKHQLWISLIFFRPVTLATAINSE